jgi:methylglutaconyl-CoA hydratase
MPKPLVARVQGDAYGGGVGLLAVSDAAIAAEGARVALTEVRLGLIPATIGPYVLARLTPAAARRLFFSPRRIGAAEAGRAGLVARAVAPEALDEAVEAEIAPWLEAAPGAVADAKALQRRLAGRVDEAAVAASVEALANRWETAEAAEGIAAFFAKRTPPWQSG